MISFKQKGSLAKTESFLKRNLNPRYLSILDRYGKEGVNALSAATPKDSGETADSWYYEIRHEGKQVVLSWMNSHTHNNVPVAILLQYGHATRNGGFVQGRDFINPTLRPIFDKLASEAWKEVIR